MNSKNNPDNSVADKNKFSNGPGKMRCMPFTLKTKDVTEARGFRCGYFPKDVRYSTRQTNLPVPTKSPKDLYDQLENLPQKPPNEDEQNSG